MFVRTHCFHCRRADEVAEARRETQAAQAEVAAAVRTADMARQGLAAAQLQGQLQGAQYGMQYGLMLGSQPPGMRP